MAGEVKLSRKDSMGLTASALEIVEFSKEFFVTEQGEVIKIGAMKAYDLDIINKYSMDGRPLFDKKMKKIKSGEVRENYISIFKVENDSAAKLSQSQKNDNLQFSSFTVIVFHARNEDHQYMLTKQTQYCVVGNYLCHRYRNR